MIAGLLAVAAAGCSSGATSTEPTAAATDPSVTTTDVAPVDATPADATPVDATTTDVPRTSIGPSSAASTTEPVSTASIPVLDTIATVPEDGVPGIDSEDAFCRGWGEFAGSFQALALVSSLGADPVRAARLEVVASAAVLSAARSLDEAFPDAIADERLVFVDGVIGPLTRRAARAHDALAAAGLSAAELGRLGDLWLGALVDAGVDDPEIAVEVPIGLADEVDAAVGVFVATVPSISEDPSLITVAAAPATFAYLAERCPDQGILGGNDAID